MPDKTTTRKNVESTAATAAATGKKFCLDHNGLASADNGDLVRRAIVAKGSEGP